MKPLSLLFLCIFILGYSITGHSQTNNQKTNLVVNNRVLSLNSNLGQLIKALDKAPGQLVYIQVDKINSVSKFSKINVEQYLGNNLILVYISAIITSQELSAHSITAWASVLAEDKINPLLLSEDLQSQKSMTLLISVRKGIQKDEIYQQLLEVNGKLNKQQKWEKQNLLEITIPANKILSLAKSTLILYVQPLLKPQQLNNRAIGFTNAQVAHQPIAIGGYNLKGQNVTIGVGDNGDPGHIDYMDRLRSFNPIPDAQHGSHVTGTVGGNGIVDERYKGFAPQSSLISDFFSEILNNAATYTNDFGMVVTSNSYGLVLGNCTYAGTYDLYSQFLDQQALDLPNLLTVFAAANDGNYTCSPYPQGYATVTASYATAKNVLTVANIGKTRDIFNQSSSTGPVKDGRLKPEIAAVGTKLISTLFENTYGSNSGTSMATPNVAGGAGLLYQRFKQVNANQIPANALIKNILMNGADDIDHPGPDYRYGFGLMNIGHSLRIIDNGRFFSNEINTNQTQTFTITIPAQTAKAKIMLNWNDPAAAAIAGQTLINDLDLTVIDPSSATHFPLILNANPGQVTQNALPGVDHINNTEQVTIINPTPGTYTIQVKGFNVPIANQKYFISYDFDPLGIKMQYPFGGESIAAGDSTYIYWEASDDISNFELSYSTNNGSNWNVLDNNLSPQKRAFVWFISDSIQSNNCLVRVKRGSTTAVSQKFTIIKRPTINLIASANQCPGSIKFKWGAIPGANNYTIFKKQGADMVAINQTLDTTYTMTGLSQDSIYWFSAAPNINGSVGMRAVALSFKPNAGNCSEVLQHGDLAIQTINSPTSGRKNTATELSAATPFIVTIKNLDNQIANNYKISYQINNGSWQAQDFTFAINSTATKMLTLNSLNLSNVGTYSIKIAVTNLAISDPITANDTLVFVVRQIENSAMDLTNDFLADFENLPTFEQIGKSEMGVANTNHWDYQTNKAIGRIRSFVNSNVLISGSKSISLDNSFNVGTQSANTSFNLFTGTFNLSTYAFGTEELRCSFDYLLHGLPKFDSGNQVWLRGDDLSPWIPILSYQIDTNNLGQIYPSGSISLNDILSANNQNFSSSVQVRFGQKDTGKIGSNFFGNGVTIDNFSIYTVIKDIELMSIVSVPPFNCNLGSSKPLSVQIANGVNEAVNNISVSYQLGNNPIITEMINSINAKDTIIYTFNALMDLSTLGNHNLSVWLNAPGDSYNLNDSILNYQIRNQPLISSFPYLENFETSDGSFFTNGSNTSWAYGTPTSTKIDHAASGTKAWKTNLSGHYNDYEISFLYSPCYDISQLQNPTLSFSLASDLEPPGEQVFDHAYMEYSTNGLDWIKIQQSPKSYNLYNNEEAQVWAKPGETYWQVVTTPLPVTQGPIAFRFVLKTDPASNFEGIALDDIHIYDLENEIFIGDSILNQAPISIAGQNQNDFIAQNQITASILTQNETMSGVKVQSYHHDQFINHDSTQYYLPRNFTVKTTSSLTDSVLLRLYVPDEAMKTIREDVICYSCSQPKEVQQLGITKYQDPNSVLENNLLTDNNDNGYSFIPKTKLTWVPYAKGYYVDLKLKSFSEFWFNDGGPQNNQTLNIALFKFDAQHLGNRYAELTWSSKTDESTNFYQIQRADQSMEFNTIATIQSVQNNNHVYSYIDTPQLDSSAHVFYRILYQNDKAIDFLSVIRQLNWDDYPGNVNAYPNPVSNGILFLDWFKGNNNPIEWSIYDIQGRSVEKGTIDENNYDGNYQLNLGKLGIGSGIYIIKINSGKEQWEFKIVKL